MNKGNRGGWKPWFRGRGGYGMGARTKALMSRPGNKDNDSNLNAQGVSVEEAEFSIKAEKGCPYNEWKLYFPKLKFSEAQHINRRIMAMRTHFQSYPHWYDFDTIATTFALHLPLEKLVDDDNIETNWPTWYEDFASDPANTLAAVALAVHTDLDKVLKKEKSKKFLKKIFVRPIGWRPVTPLKEIQNFEGKLVSTSGVVKSVENIEATPKYVCFQCSTCSGQLCVEQSVSGLLVRPSTCVKGCSARSNFFPLMSSPFTVVTPKQTLLLREIAYQKEDSNVSIEVELSEDQVSSVSAGAQVVITGIVAYKHDYVNANQAKNFKPYFKCYSIVCHKGMDFEMYKHIQNNEIPEIVQYLKSESNIFKLLVHSFCPDIYGREEAKAALLLALLSGNKLIETRRSDSHVLLLGNPGTGKSKLLLTAAMLSPRGMFVCGTLTSAVGLTASVGSAGAVDAGALVLSDNGDCCIDELDKTGQVQMVLLEAMEQQEISIAKCGTVTVLPARCSVLASANPNHSIYDRSKSIMQNVKFTPQLISRFDLIVPFAENVQTNNWHFTEYMLNKSKIAAEETTSMDDKFFDQSQENKSVHWIKFDPSQNIRTIPARHLKDYIEFVKHRFHPKLSKEALFEIKNFYKEFSELCRDKEDLNINGPSRFIEAIIRMTLSRARAEMTSEATAEHVKDVIWLIKYTSIDIYGEYDQGSGNTSEFAPIKKKINLDSSKPLSKPKQMKAFMEFLSIKCDEENRNVFTMNEIKAMAAEIGIKDFQDIVYRLNNEGSLLKTTDGYRVIKL